MHEATPVPRSVPRRRVHGDRKRTRGCSRLGVGGLWERRQWPHEAEAVAVLKPWAAHPGSGCGWCVKSVPIKPLKQQQKSREQLRQRPRAAPGAQLWGPPMGTAGAGAARAVCLSPPPLSKWGPPCSRRRPTETSKLAFREPSEQRRMGPQYSPGRTSDGRQGGRRQPGEPRHGGAGQAAESTQPRAVGDPALCQRLQARSAPQGRQRAVFRK